MGEKPPLRINGLNAVHIFVTAISKPSEAGTKGQANLDSYKNMTKELPLVCVVAINSINTILPASPSLCPFLSAWGNMYALKQNRIIGKYRHLPYNSRIA